MRIRIVMYGGVVTDVYVVPDQADRPWLRLDEEFEYPLENLIDDKKRGSE